MKEREDLKAFLDGELPPTRMAEMHDALARDPVLAAEADELRRLSTSVISMRADPQVLGLESAVAAVSLPKRWWMPSARVLAGVAALALAAVALLRPSDISQQEVARADKAVALGSAAESSPSLSVPSERPAVSPAPAASGSASSKAKPSEAPKRKEVRKPRTVRAKPQAPKAAAVTIVSADPSRNVIVEQKPKAPPPPTDTIVRLGAAVPPPEAIEFSVESIDDADAKVRDAVKALDGTVEEPMARREMAAGGGARVPVEVREFRVTLPQDQVESLRSKLKAVLMPPAGAALAAEPMAPGLGGDAAPKRLREAPKVTIVLRLRLTPKPPGKIDP